MGTLAIDLVHRTATAGAPNITFHRAMPADTLPVVPRPDETLDLGGSTRARVTDVAHDLNGNVRVTATLPRLIARDRETLDRAGFTSAADLVAPL